MKNPFRRRSKTASKTVNLKRIEKILFLIDKNGKGLEFGASHSPITPKSAGYNVEILDCEPAEVLREKFRGDVGTDNIDKIEEVDYVWRGEDIVDLIGKPKGFDWIIASHVIEHTTDLISFLQACSALLKDDGVISLAIPDKRYCFDFLRYPSTTGDALQAWLDKRKRHSFGTVFDFSAQLAQRDGRFSWREGFIGKISLKNSLGFACERFEAAKVQTNYIDVHSWRFVPSSFRLILLELRQMGIVDLRIEKDFPTAGCEFFVSLKKSTNKEETEDRLDLYKQIYDELRVAGW